MKTRITALLATLFLTQAAYSINYNESGAGELSGNPSSPTQLGALDRGSNIVSGNNGFGALDCFTFVIPSGSGLININASYNGFFDLGSIFLDRGGSSVAPNGQNHNSFLGGMLFSIDDSGTDILPELSSGQNGTTGFSVPLGPGVYTIVFRDNEEYPNTYSLDFVVGDGPAGGGGGGGGGGPVSPIVYTPRPDQPDLMIGTKRNKGKGNNIYNGSGGNQGLILRSERARRVKAFITLENDGIQEDVYQIEGGGKNRLFKVKYFKKGAGNVTADFLLGSHFDALKVNEKVSYEIRVQPIRSRLRKNGRIRHRSRKFPIEVVSQIDALSVDATSLSVWTDSRK